MVFIDNLIWKYGYKTTQSSDVTTCIHHFKAEIKNVNDSNEGMKQMICLY